MEEISCYVNVFTKIGSLRGIFKKEVEQKKGCDIFDSGVGSLVHTIGKSYGLISRPMACVTRDTQ